MMPLLLAIYGAGGFGREVMPIAVAQLREKNGDRFNACFVDDVVVERVVNGAAVMHFDDVVKKRASRKLFNVAVANPEHRASLATKCKTAGMEAYSLFAATSLISEESYIGEGAILCPYTVVTVNSRIGRFFHGNLYSYVAHDCRIGDFVTFAPGVKCNGHVIIEDGVYIGAGAVLLPGRKDAPLLIGRGATVAAGAVVMRNVLPGVTVIGNPARPLLAEI
jgi:sugar O-acyltransferase (sialic acid O-acetyltransferase NeuD family)